MEKITVKEKFEQEIKAHEYNIEALDVKIKSLEESYNFDLKMRFILNNKIAACLILQYTCLFFMWSEIIQRKFIISNGSPLRIILALSALRL